MGKKTIEVFIEIKTMKDSESLIEIEWFEN